MVMGNLRFEDLRFGLALAWNSLPTDSTELKKLKAARRSRLRLNDGLGRVEVLIQEGALFFLQ